MSVITIGIEQLEVGMYVLEIAEQRAGTVHIKSRGRVTSEAAIKELKRKGITRVVIETDVESNPTAGGQPLPANQHLETAVPVERELVRAEKLYQQGIKIQKNLYKAIQSGTVFDDYVPREFSTALVGSLDRNPDALLLMTKIRKKDSYLLEHSLNVGILLANFGRFLGLEEQEVEQLAYSGLLHDLGKIKIDDAILHKPGRLTTEEMEEMKKHVNYGVEFLHQMKIAPSLIKWVSEHHERLDGLGYPAQLKAEDITQQGRMLAIVDMYDALTADRCYKAGMSSQKALQILLKDSKNKLDPALLQQFIRCMGIYPVGSLVELSNRKVALVMKQNEKQPLKPLVRVFYSTVGNHYLTPKEVNLATDDRVKIEKAVVASDYGIDINRFFNESVLP
ncbi:MAG: HD-GYP domain-containing protein [Aestuariibacter sp.]|jgi:putative nucleotidyltransferase with HDIG domain|uniref:HD-GYP domain-containing protein n=1 Tax=Marisediminitalea aggregata TaxID=634436 RepID=UPI0020CC82A8|nr:HD-GYP domain-containing protein [Marisediminitalea aggregata]MCP4524657.1 HD-GYP domain-containing protein [Aestuariibacter sp.]MCP9476648.1 HD-GYP domain-containing protein [Marisediminitalea aggregata]